MWDGLKKLMSSESGCQVDDIWLSDHAPSPALCAALTRAQILIKI